MRSLVKATAENPITSTMGLLVLLNVASAAGIAILDNDPTTVPNWDMVIHALIGLAMVVAKDCWKFWEKKKKDQA